MVDFAAQVRLDGSAPEPDLRARLRLGFPDHRASEFLGGWFAVVAAPARDRRCVAVDPTGRYCLAFDGRLDDRPAVADLARLSKGAALALSDAELLLAGFSAVGESVWSELVGPWALLLLDGRLRSATLARDPMGGRTLFLSQYKGALIVASRVATILAVDEWFQRPDESSIARFLAGRGPKIGATFFLRIDELSPGETLRIRGSRREVSFAPELQGSRVPGGCRDEDYAVRFRELLHQAVSCRLSSEDGTAILMSGGLDSTAVASVTAKLLRPEAPVAVSWVFPGRAGTDESVWIDAANQATGTRGRAIAGFELGPLAQEGHWPRWLDAPVLGPYSRLRQLSFATAREEGCSVLLTGESGDQLWSGGRDWLRDLARAGRLLLGTREVLYAASLEARGDVSIHTLRGSVARALGLSSGPRVASPAQLWPWLTSYGRDCLRNDSELASAAGARGGRLSEMLSSLDLAFLSAARLETAAYGVEIRRPFRDRRLVEFLLGVPAHLLYRPAASKWLLRLAVRDDLPKAVVERRAVTSLVPLFDHAVRGQAWPLIRAALKHPGAIWPRYVRSDWLWDRAVGELGNGRDGVARVILWHCYCLERWRATLEGRNLSGPAVAAG